MMYLSPAFTPRKKQDQEFLAGIHGSTGFGLFWIDVVRPLLEANGAKRILEIGADQGQHTSLLIDYCKSAGGTLTVIEPFVAPSLRGMLEHISFAKLIAEKSEIALGQLTESYDAVLLEGDLNYGTVSNDLAAIEALALRFNSPFPLLLTKNASWPYAFRDMYYDPERTDPGSMHPYAMSGMTPWSSELVPGKLNSNFANAQVEGGNRNGVFAAVKDFAESRKNISMFRIPFNFGLGILYTNDSPAGRYIDKNLQPPPGLALLIETFEIARINEIIRQISSPLAPTTHEIESGLGIKRRLVRLLRRIGRAILRRLEK